MTSTKQELDRKTHVFFSHDVSTDEFGRDNHARVAKVNAWLQSQNVVTCFHADTSQGKIVQHVYNDIDNSLVHIVFVTQSYIDKVAGKNGQGDACLLEYNYALNLHTIANTIIVVHEDRCRSTQSWEGPVGA